jgi:hypothetical protein
VSRPSEDICNQCCAFANHHRYKSGSDDSLNSEADASLFLEPPPFCDFDSDSDEEEEYNNDKPEEEPTIESNQQPTEKSAVEQLLENSDAMAEDPALEEREQMIGRACLHDEMARAQYVLYAHLISKARCDALDKVEHNKRTYTFLVDYGQNMEIYQYSTKSNRGPVIITVLSAFITLVCWIRPISKATGRQRIYLMYCHVYHEGVGSKGGNNVCSLIHKTLEMKNLLRLDNPGLELNIVFDNCSGQNKSNTVIKYLLRLSEMGYFCKVNFVFLIVGHTKNSADRLFNALKLDY